MAAEDTATAGSAAGTRGDDANDDADEEEDDDDDDDDGGDAGAGAGTASSGDGGDGPRSSGPSFRKGRSIRNVETDVCGPLKDLFASPSAKLIGSGREDRDVRMLGRGRPFLVEILDPNDTTGDIDAL